MMARIVLAGTPQPELGLGGVVEEGRERGDLADVEGGVRPAVQAMADAGRQRVVHGGVAERAGDAETRHLAEVVDLGADADDGIQLQQGDGDSGVVEALVGADRRDDFSWQRVNVDLEAEAKCRNRGNCADHVVHLQGRRSTAARPRTCPRERSFGRSDARAGHRLGGVVRCRRLSAQPARLPSRRDQSPMWQRPA